MRKYKRLTIELEDGARLLAVGDVHGRYDLLMRSLDKIDYDEEKDFLVTPGDMIDRGLKSTEVVKFFTEHSRRRSTFGNHEDLALAGSHYDWLYNGGRYTQASLSICGKTEEWLKNKVANLPLVLDISVNDLVYRFVHAEIPNMYDEAYIQTKLSSENKDIYFNEALIWGRADIGGHFRFGEEGSEVPDRLSKNQPIPTFVGHTPVNYYTNEYKPYKLGTRTYLDMGMGALCTYDITNDKYYILPA